jgi:integrase
LVWASFQPPHAAASTLIKKLGHLDRFYIHSDQRLGPGGLDEALAQLDVERLCGALESYFFAIRNAPPITAASEERWRLAVQFVLQTADRLNRGAIANEQRESLHDRLSHLQFLNSHLLIGRRRHEQQIRSLPAVVLEALYEMLDPECPRNPFRGIASRWRVYTVFMLLLHQGLRRGELLGFPVDVVKRGSDRSLQKDRCWMTVRYNEYEEDDPRYSRPSIKTPTSVRHIPVSRPIAVLVEEYVVNYRGKTDHSFLMNSQKRLPLSTEAITKMFQKVSDSLPRNVRSALLDYTGEDSVRAHDLRHTCAVVRLNQLLKQGVEMDDALQRMRGFFGWSRDSEMPLRYARAVFEDRLVSVWNDAFDERVEVLRNLPAKTK